MAKDYDDMRKAKFGEVYEFVLPAGNPKLRRVIFVCLDPNGWYGPVIGYPDLRPNGWSMLNWKKVEDD